MDKRQDEKQSQESMFLVSTQAQFQPGSCQPCPSTTMAPTKPGTGLSSWGVQREASFASPSTLISLVATAPTSCVATPAQLAWTGAYHLTLPLSLILVNKLPVKSGYLTISSWKAIKWLWLPPLRYASRSSTTNRSNMQQVFPQVSKPGGWKQNICTNGPSRPGLPLC